MGENKLTKKYGLMTAICMVVGIVIGSGVFFKAQNILEITNGDMPLGILAWAIGGAVMLICALTFSTLATRYEKVNGLVDYAEAVLGPRYAYNVAWFSALIYLPAMTSVLAWVSARYTLALFGSNDMTGGLCLALAALFLCGSYALNSLSPRLAGKFQVSTTFIKLIPLLLMMIVGVIAGLINGNTADAFATAGAANSSGGTSPLFAAIVMTAFAYEGWIIATSINAELHNAKRNLPLALVIGSIIVAGIYILYYIGLTGATTVPDLIANGSPAAFTALFGRVGGSIVNALIVISCLGTLNGLMLACTRGMFAIGARGQGPRPEIVREISPGTNMPTNSSVIAVFTCALWLFYFYGANLYGTPLFGVFSFDSSELPIITIYAFYIPIFLKYAWKHGKEGVFRHAVMPVLATLASLFMIVAALYAHGISPYQEALANGKFSFPVLFYLIVFAVVMIAGQFFYRKDPVLNLSDVTEEDD